MKYIISLLFLIISNVYCNSQSFDWVNTVGSSDADAIQYLCSDSSNNIYSYGYFSDTLRINNSSNTYVSRGTIDIFLLKNDEYGNFISCIQIGGYHDEWPTAIQYDNSGFLYLLGKLSDSVYINNGVSSQLIFLDTNWNAASSGFLMKLDLNGNIKWSQFFENNNRLDVNDIAINDSSNIIVVGSYEDSLDFGIENSRFNLSSNNTFSGFIAKIAPTGSLLKTTSIRGSQEAFIQEIETAANTFTITGSYRGTVDADPSSNNYYLNSNGGYAIFFSQYNDDLTFRWAKSINSKLQAESSTLFEKDNFYYMGGVFADTTFFDPNNSSSYLVSKGNWDAFLSKYDINGNLLWANQFGDILAEYLQRIYINDLNEIFLIGMFQGTVDFDPDSSIFSMTSNNGSSDIFISKFDTSGVFYWAKIIGGNYTDYSYDIIGNQNQLYIGGLFSNSVDFDFDSNQVIRNSFGDTDAYLLKISLSITTLLNEINDKGFDSKLHLYPNPSTKILNIKGNLNQIESFAIYDLNGRQVSKIIHESEIDISSLSEGIFLLNIYYKDGSVDSIKFIKTR